MYFSTAFFLFLLSQDVPEVNAKLTLHSISRATERLHKYANYKSSRIARDLRLVFQGLAVDQSSSELSQRVYCVRPDALSSLRNDTDTTSTSPATATSTGSSSSPTITSAYKLVESHSGSNFFDGWTFWDIADPTNGLVDYQSQSDAQSGGLVSVNSDGNALIKVDTTSTITGNRKCVRITTESTFTKAIFTMDAVHMPQGCGTWPAFWSNGPDWPTYGEIDIIEGVNDYTNNQATLHTASGCTIASNSTPASLNISGTLVGVTNCAAAETGNQGCGTRSSSNTTYGSGFNSIGGGVYAMVWDDAEIAVHFFPHGSVPSDLEADAPLPDTWGVPMARWPSTTCDTSKFFQNHSVIIDTTLCGDWAGGVWNDSGIPGQETSCAQRTGYSTCDEFVQKSGASFTEAYWEISSVKMYQTERKS